MQQDLLVAAATVDPSPAFQSRDLQLKPLCDCSPGFEKPG